MHKKLNIGFILHGNLVPAWYAQTISSCIKETDCTVQFIRFPESKFKAPLPFLYRSFLRFEEHWFRSEYNAEKQVEVDDIVRNVQSASFAAHDGYVLNEEALDALKGFQFDLIYTIGFDASLSENISGAAKFGLWYLQFGFDDYQNTAVPAFWEVMDASPVVGSSLLMRREGKDFILFEGTTPSVPFSVKNTFNAIAWKSSSYLIYRAKTLLELQGNFATLFDKPFVPVSAKRKWPGIAQMAFLFSRNVLRYIAYKQKLKSNNLRFTLLYAQTPFNVDTFHLVEYSAVPLPAGAFFADPFVIHHNNINYIFFEEYQAKNQKAHISVIEVHPSREVTASRPVLERPYHLSYPYVFQLGNEFFMIPETAANGTVELYRAAEFPAQWELVMTLMEGRALLDCTVFFHDNKWWLFANQSNHPFASTNDQLFLYYSDHLFSGNWTPHPLNPIVSHASNCRPGGRIFQKNGKLYRPAQNNASQQYGFGLNINEVEVLNTQEYRERLVAAIHPAQLGLKAIHHVDFSENMIVIDGIPKTNK